MLKDELSLIREFIQDIAGTSGLEKDRDMRNLSLFLFPNEIVRIRTAWQQAMFSAVSDEALKRYFEFHLTEISKLSDDLYYMVDHFKSNSKNLSVFQVLLTSLIDTLTEDNNRFLTNTIPAPAFWRKRCIDRLSDSIKLLKNNLSISNLPRSLKSTITSYLDEMQSNGNPGEGFFCSFFYLQHFTAELADVDPTGIDFARNITEKLVQLNFNNLGFFHYLQSGMVSEVHKQHSLSTKLDFLTTATLRYSAPTDISWICNQNWPSLKIMLINCIKEQINIIKVTCEIEQEPPIQTYKNKIALNLSVAHLACLIRLFYLDERVNQTSLKDIFTFVASNFRTKKQNLISTGSLSKEYYSVDQITAANVQALLKRMLNEINRNFFPLLVATSISYHFQ